jgi:hypothetical protein
MSSECQRNFTSHENRRGHVTLLRSILAKAPAKKTGVTHEVLRYLMDDFPTLGGMPNDIRTRLQSP